MHTLKLAILNLTNLTIMSKSTQRRSILARTLVLVAGLFASGAADKKAFATSGQGHASGPGWGSGAVYSPKRGAFKGYMRNNSSFNKNR